LKKKVSVELKMKAWIEKHGGKEIIAEKLGVQEATVRVWLRGAGSPTASVIDAIITLSKGKLSFKQIYSESTRNKK
jgi:hypothetical protein